MSLLSVRDLGVSFSGLRALHNVNLEIPAGQIAGLIGPNGAGKTTLLNCISGLYRPTAGEIVFNGSSLAGAQMHEIAMQGIARTFQNLEGNTDVSVLDNVVVGCMWRYRSPLLAELLGLPKARQQQEAARQDAWEALKRFDLHHHADQRLGSLSFGTQKLIELARAMVSKPRLLLLDEPAAGLNAEETESLGRLVAAIREESGTTVLLIEHDMPLVMGVCDHIFVLDHGEKIAEGTPAEVREDSAVRAAYLGEGDEVAEMS